MKLVPINLQNTEYMCSRAKQHTTWYVQRPNVGHVDHEHNIQLDVCACVFKILSSWKYLNVTSWWCIDFKQKPFRVGIRAYTKSSSHKKV